MLAMSMRDGQRTDAAGHGRIGAGQLLDGLGIDVANQLAVGLAIHADVNHSSAGMDEIAW